MEKINAENLAKDIFNWLNEHEMWIDVSIYFDGKCWSTTNKDNTDFTYNEGKYFEYDDEPTRYFEYVAENHILSMSFEGDLYHVLNAYVPNWVKLESEFQAIFEKHGVYYEMGNAWNLTCYPI